MKIIFHQFLLTILLSAGACAALAQKQFNNWYFGNGLGVNFNTQPPSPLYDGMLSSVEGCSVMSDAEGKILFYSNGVNIYNKAHQVMDNGSGLEGDISSTSNSVIVQLPGNDSIYYLFVTGASFGSFKNLTYNIINVKSNNGLGKVIQKNIFLQSDIFEKIAAARHCNRKDAWITVRKFGTDEIHAYLLSANGLSSPVISHDGFMLSGYELNMLGALKFTTDGSKMVSIHPFENNKIELQDFNTSTGVFSHPVFFSPNNVAGAEEFRGMYGAEFSPSGRLLYVSISNSSTDPCSIFQFDITSNDAAAILNSKLLVGNDRPHFAGALQLAPDKKIYLSVGLNRGLASIENPDVSGLGCNFQLNTILFTNSGSAKTQQYGLPSFVASDIDNKYAVYSFNSTRSAGCVDLDVQFNITDLSGIDSVKWDFGDGTNAVSTSPLHTYATPSSYQVILSLYGKFCGVPETRKVIQTVRLSPRSDDPILPADVQTCIVQDYVIKSNQIADTYLWSTGETTDSISVNATGTYWLEIVKEGCASRDSFSISLQPPTKLNLGNDTVVCYEKGFLIDAGPGRLDYKWNTGETTRSIFVNKAGTYEILSSLEDCVIGDTLVLTWGDCDFNIPNTFSPNGDYINDYFGPVSGLRTSFYKMVVYNRFGQIIFSSEDAGRKWDGTLMAVPQPVGTYVWTITYMSKAGKLIAEKGTVTLIR